MIHHVKEADYRCQRCRLWVEAYIPHECNPSICGVCNGNRQVWGKDSEGLSTWVSCTACRGTGLTQWGEDEGMKV